MNKKTVFKILGGVAVVAGVIGVGSLAVKKSKEAAIREARLAEEKREFEEYKDKILNSTDYEELITAVTLDNSGLDKIDKAYMYDIAKKALDKVKHAHNAEIFNSSIEELHTLLKNLNLNDEPLLGFVNYYRQLESAAIVREKERMKRSKEEREFRLEKERIKNEKELMEKRLEADSHKIDAIVDTISAIALGNKTEVSDINVTINNDSTEKKEVEENE